jgi:outer membrane immunogenic protein
MQSRRRFAVKTAIVATAISVLATGSVLAADLSYRAPVATPSAFDWNGLYFGGSIGGAWESVRSNDDSYNIFNNFGGLGLVNTGGAGNMNSSSSSFLGGVQAGANYQIGRLVLGTELDWSWTKLNPSVTGGYPIRPGAGVTGSETFSESTKWIGTATTRLGVARDNWLFYGKAGAAWASSSYTLAGAETGGAGVQTLGGTFSRTRPGWTVGTGLEWGWTPNWIFRLEYDYINLGTATETIPAGGVTTAGVPYGASVSANVSQSINEVKVGLSYKMPAGFFFW